MNKLKILMIGLMVLALLATFAVGCSSDEEEYDLKISVSPAGGGTTSPAVGTHTYDEGDVITITATAAAGYEFDSWTGDVADTSAASTTVTMDADQTVTAKFVEAVVTYTLTMAVDPTGGGTTDPAVGTHDYDDGTEVDITATAADGYVFDSWTGDVDDTSAASTTVTMDADQSVTANFVEEVTLVTIDSTINEIMALTGGEDLLRECLGDDIVDGGLVSMGGSMSLPTIQPMSQGMVTDDMIDCVEAGLEALQGGGEAVTIDSPLGDIAEVPGGLELLNTCIGESIVTMFLQMAPEYSFPEAMAMPQAAGMLTQEMLDCLEAGIADL